MDRDPDERPQPDGAAPDEFDAIVALWRDEGDVPEWPDDDAPEAAAPPTDLDDPAPAAQPPPPMPPRSYSPPPLPEDEHFIPPEPPPLPRLGPPALVGLTLIVVGLVLVVAPGWLGVASPYGLPLGLVGLASGLGWLVLRLWPDPPDRSDDDGDDDGAVI
ncbi:DUF308 domain-containing protein [Pseudonocardia adelaidensis]|uniref:DUF308 domain-containing protein n=1 Tax=Pseudonocardia adelaidensis TaxID=648754 RepID=A0ABP9NGR6_9PSEU